MTDQAEYPRCLRASGARNLCAALAVVLLPLAAHGQTAPVAPIPPPSGTAAPAAAPAPPALTPEARAAVDERIAKLQAELGITHSQMPLWSAFARAMRDNAASTDQLFAQRAGAVAKMNAAQNMRSYAEIARAYADNTERLASAFDALYAALSDKQKEAADTLFRQQAIAAAKPQQRRR